MNKHRFPGQPRVPARAPAQAAPRAPGAPPPPARPAPAGHPAIVSRVRAFGWRAAAVAPAVALAFFVGPAAQAAPGGSPGVPFTHQLFNNLVGPPAPLAGAAVGESTYKNPPSPICSLPASTAANVTTDCEGTGIHDETSIADNPASLANLVGGANDYQIRVTNGVGGGPGQVTLFTRAHVSFDGGKTWAMYPVPANGYSGTGDPAVAFDASGTAYLATLGSTAGLRGGFQNPDILVAHSPDGGKTWDTVRVASGTGVTTGPGIFNDKEYIAAWGDGNVIVTWTRFVLGTGGAVIRAPIFDAVSHDGGNTWTAPQEISGSAPFCLGATAAAPAACDQDQFSVPAVASDGSIYVSFESTYNLDPASLAFGADQYLVVKVDPATGARLAGPYLVAHLVDGVYDYPVSIDGRQTYADSEFRTNSGGNLAADPANPAHLAVVWSDMRNSPLPASTAAYNPDPYAVTTNSDIVVSQSYDGGVTWSAPATIAAPGDQYMPWAAYDTSGRLHIGYYDRSYDPANHKYGYTLATETSPGSLTFTTTQATTALSDPTQGDLWFGGITVNPAFPHPTTFLGDYTGIAATPTGVASYWTDMRNNACITVRSLTFCGSGQDAFFAR